ncbi:MAG: type II toxin-antitoxin system Phd/YefM family antitoxin [Candidatus Dormibacteria bacterium]
MEIGAYEAKTRLSELLREVEQGKRFTITKHGVPIALLLPFGSPAGQLGLAETIEELGQFSKGIRLAGTSLRDLIEEGRR